MTTNENSFTRTLGEAPITLSDIENYDTFILKDGKLISIAKWVVKGEVMRMHGKIIDAKNPSPITYSSFIVDSQSESKNDEESLDDAGEKIIVFDVKITEEIWKSTIDDFTLTGLYDLLLAFQVFDIELSPAVQRKIAFNYLADAKERGERDWNMINKFDISVFEDCAFLCGTGILDMISKNSCMDKLDTYFSGRKDIAAKIDPERIKKFLTGIKDFPKFESIIDVHTFAKMLEICFDMKYYYLFSEIYCSIICVPGSTYIFDLEVAKVYSRWVDKFRVQGDDRYVKQATQEDKKVISNTVSEFGPDNPFPSLPQPAKDRKFDPKFVEFKLNDRSHEMFQHMAVKFVYIAEVLNMYKGNCERIELDPTYNFLCPCYMVPIRKHKTCSINSCDDNKCHCHSIILSINEIKKRLNTFMGGYLQDLDLSKSAITGSAMAVCPFKTSHEHALEFEQHINLFYGKTLTKADSGDFHRLLNEYRSTKTYSAFYSEENKKGFSIGSGSERTRFEEISGTDVDILVNTDDLKEFDQIANKHIAVIQSKYPQVQIKKITVHNGSHKYKVLFPDHEQRDVEIYYTNVDKIVSYHLGCVRAYYSTMHGKEMVTCFPSYLMTIMTKLTPDIRFVPGSKPIKSITSKYELRGFFVEGTIHRRFHTPLKLMSDSYRRGESKSIHDEMHNIIDVRNLFQLIKINERDRRNDEHDGQQFNENIEASMQLSTKLFASNYSYDPEISSMPCYHLLQLISYIHSTK